MLKVILMISICRAIVNPGDFDKKSTPHIDVRTGPGQHFVFTIECDGKVISTIVIIIACMVIIIIIVVFPFRNDEDDG